MTVNPELTRLSEQLGLRPSELAKLAGLVPSSLMSKCKARELDATLTPIARILVTATEMAGDENTSGDLVQASADRRMEWQNRL